MIRIVIEIDAQPGSTPVQVVHASSAPAPHPVPPAPHPVPSTPPTPAPPAMPSAAGDLAHGKQVFFDLLTLWLSGYDDPEAPQPDRALHMGRIFQVRHDALSLKMYLEHVRSLEAAIIDCYPATEMLRAGQIAANMAQVASAMQFPLIPRIYYEGVGLRANPEPGAP